MDLNISVDKHAPAHQQELVKSARWNLLVAVAFTVLNVVMLLCGSNRYFLFSMTVPYYLTFFGYRFDHFMIGTYTYTGLVMAVMPVLILALCWLMSKKNHRWLLGGAVVFGLDTAALVALLLWSGDLSGALLEIIFHGWVMISLVRGIQAARNLETLPGMEPCEPAGEAAQPADIWESAEAEACDCVEEETTAQQ